ncbi:uncharacterized protein LOC116339515 [Contarinia nasturtii]|uniref:uncharacterized protein LOC116339515 n=1 Tax=Contarinia nasturtii TaxID=265458 RepID=UPI0012D4013A|nr:uncharacterized protein LOC116339515 [Contarinia nasturtii]
MKIIFLVCAFVPLFVTPLKCEDYENIYTPVLVTDLSRFCFNAAILLAEGDTKCNGAIISSTKIVTSYKCMIHFDEHHSMYLPFSKNISVRVGSTERLSGGIIRHVDNVRRISFPLDDITLRRYPNIQHAINDLAVLSFKKPLPLGPTICPIRLAEKKDDIYIKEGSLVEMSGYNTHRFRNITELRSLTSQIIEINNKCPTFHIEERFTMCSMEGAPVILRQKSNSSTTMEEPLLLGISAKGRRITVDRNEIVKMSAFSKCLMDNEKMCFTVASRC